MRTYTFPEARPAGDGPWVDEPDKAQWVDDATGLDCLIVRNRSGALCGYVGVPEGHPAYGKDYEDVWVDVHGGLTFADLCHEGKEDGWGICHVPEVGRPERPWWLGFDCAHLGDLIPSIRAHLPERRYGFGETYKTFAYVRAECTSLAAQLAAMATNQSDPRGPAMTQPSDETHTFDDETGPAADSTADQLETVADDTAPDADTATDEQNSADAAGL